MRPRREVSACRGAPAEASPTARVAAMLRTLTLGTCLLGAFVLGGCGDQSSDAGAGNQPDPAYVELWDEFRSVLHVSEPAGEEPSAEALNEAFGWDEDSRARVDSVTRQEVCLVGRDSGVYLAVVDTEGPGDPTVLMGEADTCSFEEAEAQVVAVMDSADPSGFRILSGEQLLEGDEQP